MRTWITVYLPPFLWMIFIFYLSAQPVLPGPSIVWADFFFKKMAHMFVYAVLYILWFRVINQNKAKKQFLIPLVLTMVFAISDEFHQSFVSGRTATLRDLGFDLYGTCVALLQRQGLI